MPKYTVQSHGDLSLRFKKYFLPLKFLRSNPEKERQNLVLATI